MQTWNLDELKAELEALRASGRLHAFTASRTLTDRREFYLIQDQATRVALDQARQVEAEALRAQVVVRKPNGRLGAAAQPLVRFQPLAPQLEALLLAAAIGDEEPWELPALPAEKAPPVSNAAHALAADLAKGAGTIEADLRAAAIHTDGIFNSAELFVTFEKARQLASNGFDHTSERSRIYAEVCFSHQDPASRDSEEFLVTRWFAHPEQANLRQMCAESRDYAAASLHTQKPVTGSYSVILHADVLGELWNTFLGQLDAQDLYYKQPFRGPGMDLIPGFSGDPFELFVDPNIDYCFASRATDAFGVPQKRLRLAAGNKVEASLTSQRFAQYLKLRPTTEAGCVVIEPKVHRALDELRGTPGKVLEVLQFSGLFASKNSLTYSSEIRLARLFDNEKGTVSFVKGGNLSGNILENFGGVRWSSERTLFNHQDYAGAGLGYSGPAAALVTNVAVSS